jgi:hypothetical protein
MSKKTLGSLSDLARILEEAANPESELREDRKPLPKPARKATSHTKARIVDPKRKAWHDRRLRELVEKPQDSGSEGETAAPVVKPATTKAVATKVGGSLLQTLAAAKTAKPKSDTKRPEAWKRKPGDPLF